MKIVVPLLVLAVPAARAGTQTLSSPTVIAGMPGVDTNDSVAIASSRSGSGSQG